MNGAPSRIILPGLTSEEENAKKLAAQLLQTIERETYTNREILAACAILAACTIKARYKVMERQQCLRSFIGMTDSVLNQI